MVISFCVDLLLNVIELKIFNFFLWYTKQYMKRNHFYSTRRSLKVIYDLLNGGLNAKKTFKDKFNKKLINDFDA